jgi:Dolichyl-phosphate-mannose-protein mannosyltransferase
MTGSETTGRIVRAGAWTLVGLLCALWVWEIPRRGIDPDELEHLHAGLCVSQGLVPYRDFFEHHAPGLYYLTWPLFSLLGPKLTVLWTGRAVMLACAVATLWLTRRLATQQGGPLAGIVALAALASTTIFHAKAIELRPDVPAMLFLVWGASSAMSCGRKSWRRDLWTGVLLGLACLFTQKSVVPAAALGLGVLVSRWRSQGQEDATAPSAGMAVMSCGLSLVLGGLFVWLSAALLFGIAGAAGTFWDSTWGLLWRWSVRSSRWDYLRPTLLGDLPVWIAAGIELICRLRKPRAEPAASRGDSTPLSITVLLCLFSIPFVKATYPQFYLLWMPFLAILAGTRIARFWEREGSRAEAVWIGLAALLLGAVHFGLWHRAAGSQLAGPFPRLTALSTMAWIVPAAIVTLTGTILLLCGTRRFLAARSLLCLFGMTYGALRLADLSLWSNATQVAAIAQVHERIPENRPILDGFSGLGALRPHAWYYWWINDYSLGLIDESELQHKHLLRLQSAPPAGVLFDEQIAKLPQSVVDWIRISYQQVPGTILWVHGTPHTTD